MTRTLTQRSLGRTFIATAVALTLAAGLIAVRGGTGNAETPIHRINAGGPDVAASPGWNKDTKGSPSPFVNAAATGNKTQSTSNTIDMSDPSIPAGTPQAIFKSFRFDLKEKPNLEWDIPVSPGAYVVRLYFAEIVSSFMTVGARKFDVDINGVEVLNAYDIFKDVGGDKGVVKTFEVVTDANLDIDFIPADNKKPAINAIEVEPAAGLPGSWRDEVDLPVNRSEVAYVELGGKFHLFGGGKTHHVYDPSTDTWSTAKGLPFKVHHIQGVTLGGKIYLLGGLTAWPEPDVGTVFIYNPDNNSVTQGTPMPVSRQRGAGGVGVYDGKIYYAGGLHNGLAVNWFDVYDPVADTWTQLPDMPTARDHFHASVLNEKFWAIGGRNVQPNETTAVNEAFNFGTGQWETGFAPLPTPRGGFASVVLDGEIVIIGGEGYGQAWPTVDAYDPATDSWRSLAPMPNPRHGIQGAVCNGGIYIAGGADDQGGGHSTNVHDALFPGGTETSCTG
jgi:N-acetylneuraminic acid mutarotase